MCACVFLCSHMFCLPQENKLVYIIFADILHTMFGRVFLGGGKLVEVLEVFLLLEAPHTMWFLQLLYSEIDADIGQELRRATSIC